MLWLIAEVLLFLFVTGVGFWLFGWWTRGKFQGSYASMNEDLTAQLREMADKQKVLQKNYKELEAKMPKAYDDAKIKSDYQEFRKQFEALKQKSNEHFSAKHSDTVYSDQDIRSQLTSLQSQQKGIKTDFLSKIAGLAIPKSYNDDSLQRKVTKVSETVAALENQCAVEFKKTYKDTVYNDSEIKGKMSDFSGRFDSVETAQKKMYQNLTDKIEAIQPTKAYNETEVRREIVSIKSSVAQVEGQYQSFFKQNHQDTVYNDAPVMKSVSSLADKFARFQGQQTDHNAQTKQKIDSISMPKAYDDSVVQNKIAEMNKRFDSIPAPKAYDDSVVQNKIAEMNKKFDSIPAPKAYDDSVVQNKIAEMNKRFDSIPAPKAYDDSVVQNKIAEMNKKFNGIPTPKAYDDSGVHNKIIQMNKRIDSLSKPYNDTNINKDVSQLKQDYHNMRQRCDVEFSKDSKDTVYNDSEVRAEMGKITKEMAGFRKSQEEQDERIERASKVTSSYNDEPIKAIMNKIDGEVKNASEGVRKLEGKFQKHQNMPHTFSVKQPEQPRQKPSPKQPKMKATKKEPSKVVKIKQNQKPDDLTQIKGIGKVIQSKLRRMGVKTFAQVAAWDKKEVAHFGEKLNFKGRISREKWVPQAKRFAVMKDKVNTQQRFKKVG